MNHRNEIEAARAMLTKVLQHAREHGAAKVNHLHIAIGEIAELDQDLILAHWRDLSKGTLAEPAQLHFRAIAADAQCMACFKKYHPEGGEIRCPYCGSYGAKIVSGEEFYIESIETEIK
ncbi:MAG: hydrogenase nickel incorporation protein HypA [Anaerolineales bacterium]|nr:hydrogenase nickel incorporation protein HypA [Anaerolineales bacterium]